MSYLRCWLVVVAIYCHGQGSLSRGCLYGSHWRVVYEMKHHSGAVIGTALRCIYLLYCASPAPSSLSTTCVTRHVVEPTEDTYLPRSVAFLHLAI